VSQGTNSTGRKPGDPPSTDRPPRGPTPDRESRRETASERRLANLLFAGFILFVLGAALWLGNALVETRRLDDCVASGRRNCAPIPVPSPPSVDRIPP